MAAPTTQTLPAGCRYLALPALLFRRQGRVTGEDQRGRIPTFSTTENHQDQRGNHTPMGVAGCAGDEVNRKQADVTLPLSPRCTHVKGHGDLKQSIVDVHHHLDEYRHVCKTDVKHFNETIDQYRLMEMIHDSVSDRDLRCYLYQIIHRTVEFGGEFREIDSGISRGCPISPLLGALYLKTLDDHFSGNNLYYIRYMDDILILTKTRWQNRRAVKRLNRILNTLKVEKHPDKTFIGKIDKGFDFFGYHFSRAALKIAGKTLEHHALHIARLYERLRQKKATSDEVAFTLGQCVTRW